MSNKYSIRSPLIPFYGHTDKNIFLKLENLQPFGSYKIRGVENIINNLSSEELRDGLVAASAGNMGQAVAFMAKKNKIPCTILVPDTAPSIKINVIKNLGAKIIKLPYEQLWKIVQESQYPKLPGYFIHPANNILLTTGYQEIAKEILEDLSKIDAIVIPFGVGGLTLGVASYLKKHHSNIKVYTVEPETSHPLYRYLNNDDSSFLSVQKSIVDAIGTPEVISTVRDCVRSLVDVATLITIDQVKSAISMLFDKHHVIAEGAGAASLAVALTDQVEGENIACVISGGNIDFDKLIAIHS